MTANNQERKSRPTGEPGGAGIQKSLCGASMPQKPSTGKTHTAANPTELFTRIAEAFTAAGLVQPEKLDITGKLARCGTVKKPGGTDGAYVIHLDEWPTLWWKNYHSGDEQTVKLYEPGEFGRLSFAEKEAIRKRWAQQEAERQKALELAHKDTAARAQRLYAELPPATDENAYLKRKGVPALPGLRQAKNGALVAPALDEEGNVAALQFIEVDGQKRFLKGQRPLVCFSIPAKDGGETGPLLIAEGYATAASLHLATGHACLVAFSATCLEAVARMARKKYPERVLGICGDWDDSSDASPNPGGAGAAYAKRAAEATGAVLIQCPSLEGAPADFNDLHVKRSLVAVQRAVEAALEGEPEPMPEKLPSGFSMRTGGKGKLPGLWHKDEKGDDSDPVETWICGPLHVRGATRDENGNAWGLLLEWKDADGGVHSWAMPMSYLAGKDSSAVLQRLADEGLRFSSGKRGKDLLARFLTEYETHRRFRCVPRTGWHGVAFVLPDEVLYVSTPVGRVGRVGQAVADKALEASDNVSTVSDVSDGEQLVLQPSPTRNPFLTGGTLDGWRETVGAWAAGNTRLTLALCAAFAAPLLNFFGMEGGGFHFFSKSSSGKTTTLEAAASAWGKGASSGGFVQSWRATANGLEGLAALHSDALLCLDEIGQAPGGAVQEAAYLLGNGVGKARAAQDGGARAVKYWRTLLLSSGEISLADKIREEGGRVRAGQEVRLVDLPADDFEDIHGHASPQAFADAVKAAAVTHYGHAVRAFIRAFQAEREKAGSELTDFMAQWQEDFCPADADGQVRRVARRFLLCAGAGEMAAEWGLVPWERGAAVAAVRVCFEAWLSQRGGAGAAEDRAILEAVRLFLEQHGQSRFQDVDRPDAGCVNRVGFRQADESGTTFYTLPESFRAEVCKGHSHQRAAAVLLDAGLLLKGEGRNIMRRAPMSLPGYGRARCYVLRLEGAAV